ncbi:MAG: glycosyltransferase family 39 protein [Labilithrix sp.]|nr:glycosyltransferase family 39 protein [Labilithrix sp.]MCW5836036.1 glycosyltransferase family 39 protein [Labilithrix sp.]
MLRRWLALALRPVRELGTAERLVLFGAALLHTFGIGWGLPSTDGWDVDGIAPRDFLPGLVETFTPGRYFTYPPLHLALLALLTLPVTVVQLLRAPSLAPDDLVATFLSVPVMTTFALVARVVSLLMSLGVVLIVGRIARSIFPGVRSARAWAMAICGVEVAGTYYAHTTNLDLPALFWASAALLVLVLALERDEPRRLRRVAVFAAFAIATKDQAYAVFALSMPAVLVAWTLARPRSGRAEIAREALHCAAIAVGLVLVLDAAPFNPTGFAARVRFLTGPASQDFAQHSRDWAGRLSALEDAVRFFPNHYPVALAPILAAGAFVAVTSNEGRGRVAAVVPLLAAASFTLAFNCVARRVEERFMMPQMQLIAVYGGGVGVVVERSLAARRRALAAFVAVTAGVGVVLGLRLSASMLLTMTGDARYAAERWIHEHVKPGELVEVYGGNVYLPRLSPALTVERVDPRPTKSRNPMPGVVEKQDRLGNVDARRPRWIVVGMGHAWRYLQEERAPRDGRVLPRIQREGLADADTRDFFRALFAERAGYRRARVFHYEGSALFPPRPLHASLATDVFVFERR